MKPEEIKQAADQIGQQIAQAIGQQVGEQTAQQIAQAVSQAVSKMLQTQTQTTGSSTVEKEIAETFAAERFQVSQSDRSETKEILTNMMIAQHQKDMAFINALKSISLERSNNIIHRSQENTVENQNFASKEYLKCGGKQTDELWNPIQQAGADVTTLRAVTIDDASLKALGVTLATSIADILTKKAA